MVANVSTVVGQGVTFLIGTGNDVRLDLATWLWPCGALN